MFKLILVELLKSYIADEKPTKKSYSNIVCGIFILLGLFSLALADYYYFHQHNIKTLLIASTAFLLIAILMKLFYMWLNRKTKQQARSVAASLQKIIIEILPIAARLAPIGFAGYFAWKRARSKTKCQNPEE